MDKYSLKARIYPIVILLFPIIIIGISYSIEYENHLQMLSALAITSVLTYFLSNLGRDNGKLKEAKLWEKWGGMPSAQLLSFQDGLIDKHTKRKYHKILLELSPIEEQNIDFENAELNSVSEIYKSWTRFIISRTRDTKQFPLLFKENISYGFRRNLWGLKTISSVSLFITLIGNFGFQSYKIGLSNFVDFPIQFFVSEGLLIFLSLIWIFRINSKWIKIPAFAYGERLLENIDKIYAAEHG